MPSLPLAFLLSLALHGVLLSPYPWLNTTSTQPPPALPLVAVLRPPLPPPVFEPLLKNTLESEAVKAVETPKPPPQPPAKSVKPPAPRPEISKREKLAVARKLSQYVFYPEQAVRQGQEGQVRLFVALSADGSIEEVRLIASSGYALLDNAAIKGFYALGRLPGKSGEWSYTFRLTP